MSKLRFPTDRLKEPSTYSGISGIFAGIALWVQGDKVNGAIAIATGLAAVFLKERGAANGTEPPQ